MLLIKMLKLREAAILPTRATPQSAGWDLYLPTDLQRTQIVRSATISLGIALELPNKTVGQVSIRSSVAKRGLIIVNSPGIIDCDYRGEIKLILRNLSTVPYELEVGERLAQLVVLSLPEVAGYEVSELSNTYRGAGGLGSTGRS